MPANVKPMKAGALTRRRAAKQSFKDLPARQRDADSSATQEPMKQKIASDPKQANGMNQNKVHLTDTVQRALDSAA
jgi:hypothetical protein